MLAEVRLRRGDDARGVSEMLHEVESPGGVADAFFARTRALLGEPGAAEELEVLTERLQVPGLRLSDSAGMPQPA
jgi:hypothetical protein